MNGFDIVVPGDPVAAERPRKGRYGFYIPPKTREYQERVVTGWSVAGRPTLGKDFCAVRLTAYVARPRSHYGTGRHSAKLKPAAPVLPKSPDVDNICKGVLDALNGLAWHDDGQVARLHAERVWADELGPRTEIHCWRL